MIRRAAILVVVAACQGRAPEPAGDPTRPDAPAAAEPDARRPTDDDDAGPAPSVATPQPADDGGPDPAALVIAHAPVTTRAEALAAHDATFDALARHAESRGNPRLRQAFADPKAQRDARRQPCAELADHIRDVMGPDADDALAYGSLAALKGECWVVYTSIGFSTLATAFREPDGTLLAAWDIPEG